MESISIIIYLFNTQRRIQEEFNYRRTSVLNTMSRLYGRILSVLIEKQYINLEKEEQSGRFRAERLHTQ